LICGIIANLGMLFLFKYANFVIDNINIFLTVVDVPAIDSPPAHLPIGISFFTFQALSYIIDVYKKTTSVQQNVLSLGLSIASFSQLIAGPIVRYHDVARQIVKRTHSLELFSSGVERFVFGLSKKVLIANPMGAMADSIFALESTIMSTGTAWLGISCYTLQIYFDFSGNSDMAIGLGRMFGFRFLENFNYPYISKSIQEFWSRWHISLSNWFRDYLYIPLGGNRHGNRRTAVNLLIVFLLCGLWHGASWNFILWGLVYGGFLVAERGCFGRFMRGLPHLIQHFYVLLVVMNTWVLFRIETLKEIGQYLAAMYGNANAASMDSIIAFKLNQLFVASLAAGILLSFPVYPMLVEKIKLLKDTSPVVQGFVSLARLGV
ncbi:MAG TPA: MBOAT family protein, partial [Desulfobacterales bacterium]|nr:MBOAT family protein [Desulfobacterales bacterium]